MNELIAFLREELPDDALDIQEGIELLNQCIGGSVEGIKGIINDSIDNKDFDRITILGNILKTVNHIQIKLDEYSSMLQLDDDLEEKLIKDQSSENDDKQLPNYESLRVDQNIPHTLYDVYTHKRPAGFEIFGERYMVRDWKDALIQTCEILVSKDAAIFNSFVNDKNMHGRKVPYFTKDPNKTRDPRKVKGTDVYVMTNMSANQVRNVIEKMLRKYRIKTNDYKIYLKADYTARHV